MKKNMQSVVAQLTPIAEQLPTQSVPSEPTTKTAPSPVQEAVVQFSFSLRKSQRRDLKRLAEDNDMTTRAFILNALKDKGLNVQDEDLDDLRKGK